MPGPPEVEIVYDTDPLCAWSWAMEPSWRRLRYEFGALLRWRYRMGGMIPDWQHFDDPIQAVSRPGQMGPLWIQVEQMSGQPLDARLWAQDPPASSLPACMAFKAAELQGPWAAEAYLRRLREAGMLALRNVGRFDTLLAIAEAVSAELPPDLPFDVAQFEQDLVGHEAKAALRADLGAGRAEGIQRFPTLTLSVPARPPIRCTGFRPYESLRGAVEHLAPNLQPQRKPTLVDYVQYWGRLTLRELAVALDLDAAGAAEALESARRRSQLDADFLCQGYGPAPMAAGPR